MANAGVDMILLLKGFMLAVFSYKRAIATAKEDWARDTQGCILLPPFSPSLPLFFFSSLPLCLLALSRHRT